MKGIRSTIISTMILLNILFYNIDSVSGIRGGEVVTIDQFAAEFSHHVSVLINGHHACGGTILDANHVITAAQCVLSERGVFLDVTIHVIFGTNLFMWNIRDAIKVVYIYVWRDFRPYLSSNALFPEDVEVGDLAVLVLENALPLGQNTDLVKAASLPQKVHNNYLKYAAVKLNVSGFGQDAPMAYMSSSDLTNLHLRRNIQGGMKYTEFTVQPRGGCKRYYKHFGDRTWENHMCATAYSITPKGVCLGDVGAPLIVDNQIIGVMQIYNKNCDDKIVPAIYTRMTYYIQFVNNALKDKFQSNMRFANYTGSSVNEIIHPSRLT